MSKLIICPNEEKIKLLEENNNLEDIKYMTKNEFITNYFFDYNNKTIYYLISKYKYNLDVCKVYLKNLYPIDINKNYKSNKLNFLKDLKKELIDNNLLIENKVFKDYLKDKEIIVKNYYDLDKYEEKAMNYKLDLPSSNLNIKVVKCNTLEEEVNNVCLNILKLLEEGVDINNIYLSNVQDEYLYTINKLFNYYNIPINIDLKNSIYSTKVVKDYLVNNKIDLDNKDNLDITKKLVNVINSLVDIDKESNIYNDLLIDKLKSTYINPIKYENAVNIKDLYKYSFKENDYVFVMSFNQDILPKMYKDIEFITDKEKSELDMYTTEELNVRTKQVLINILSNIKNLTISYKLNSPFNSYYKSSLIDELNLEEVDPIIDEFNYSDIYNKLRLGEKLDIYNLYNEEEDYLDELNNHYKIPYNEYDHSFKGIDNNIYLSFIKEPLNISYSSMNSYYECAFKYYISNVLRVDSYEEMFHQFVGNLYHRILSIIDKDNFDLDKEYDYYLEHTDYDLDIKDKIFLIKIKKDLEELLQEIKRQRIITGYNNRLYEQKVEIELPNNKIKTIFKGFIDKIVYLEKLDNTYYSIIDYKTGTIDTHIEPIKYGLHMQLPVYMYLIKYGNLFKKPKFTGIYYQNILFNYPSVKDKNELLKIKKDRLKLQGYSIDDKEQIELFDTTYENSEIIKSMSLNKDGSFNANAKIISKEESNKMIEYTKNKIEEATNNIIDAKFDINPKFYNKENISCKYCSYKDICYMKETDLKYLDKVENLDFLDGGEENA